MKHFFATKVQTNAIIISLTLVAIQGYILAELNGHLYDLLTGSDPTTVGLVFAPTVALVWIGRTFAERNGNFPEGESSTSPVVCELCAAKKQETAQGAK